MAEVPDHLVIGRIERCSLPQLRLRSDEIPLDHQRPGQINAAQAITRHQRCGRPERLRRGFALSARLEQIGEPDMCLAQRRVQFDGSAIGGRRFVVEVLAA